MEQCRIIKLKPLDRNAFANPPPQANKRGIAGLTNHNVIAQVMYFSNVEVLDGVAGR